MYYESRMFWSLIYFAAITPVGAASEAFYNPSVVSVGCEIHVHWSLSHYFRFQVVVEKEFDAKFLFSLETTAHSFIFNDAEPTHTYIIKWVPLDKQRKRVTHLREEKNVTIHKDCMITPSSTKKVIISDHDSLSTSTKPTSTSFESEQEDYRIVGIASSTTLLPDSGNELFSTGIVGIASSTTLLPDSGNELFSTDFCRIYFLTSLCSIPVIVCIVSAIFYVCLMRKCRRTAQDGNIFIQKRANVNVKSTCYSNDGANEYDEVGYSLAQYIEV